MILRPIITTECCFYWLHIYPLCCNGVPSRSAVGLEGAQLSRRPFITMNVATRINRLQSDSIDIRPLSAVGLINE